MHNKTLIQKQQTSGAEKILSYTYITNSHIPTLEHIIFRCTALPKHKNMELQILIALDMENKDKLKYVLSIRGKITIKSHGFGRGLVD